MSPEQENLERLYILSKALLDIAWMTSGTNQDIFALATGAIDRAAAVGQSQQESLRPGNLPTQSQ